MSSHISNVRPPFDQPIIDIVDYALNYEINSPSPTKPPATACSTPSAAACRRSTSPPAPSSSARSSPASRCTNGARVPGTSYELDPVQPPSTSAPSSAGSTSTTPGSPPSGATPPTTSAASSPSPTGSAAIRAHIRTLTIRDVLTAMIKAHEIQGCIALENSFNKVGLDHVVLVKVASTAVVCADARPHARADASTPYRSPGSTASRCAPTATHPTPARRKSWAAGDATSRAVRLALIAKTGEMGYPSVLSAKTWGFYDVSFKGQPFKFQRALRQLRHGERPLQNLLPRRVPLADRSRSRRHLHAQLAAAGKTAADIAQRHHPHPRSLHPHHRQAGPAQQSRRPRPLHPVHGRRSAHLRPPHRRRLRRRRRADRTSRIDALRANILCVEDPQFTADYHDPDKRSIANALTVELNDGTILPEVVVEYPIGHRLRRADGIPLLMEKFRTNLARRLSPAAQQNILAATADQATLEAMPVDAFVQMFVV